MLTLLLSFLVLVLIAGCALTGTYLWHTQKALQRYQKIVDAEEHVKICNLEAEKLRIETGELKSQLAPLQLELDSAIEHVQLQEVGIYQQAYYEDYPEVIRRRLDEVVEQQKIMVKTGTACQCHIEWTVDGDKNAGRKMAEQQIKLMLRAFNGESSAAISKINSRNIDAKKNQVSKCFDSINKFGQSKQTAINPDYLNLKISELQLTHVYELAKEEEKERAQELKQQLREEQKAEREIQESIMKAEKEERLKAKALETAKKELAALHGVHNAKLEFLIAKLEGELSEAIASKSRAISRAQMTKSGHIYVISNIGTMGEGVFKIGMTRRLVPEDRVRELGDASVPFPFDVHAMIFSANAPKLENELHKYFADRRVNLVNLRREYFQCTIDEIIDGVKSLHGDATFVKTPEAVQYWETVQLRDESLANPNNGNPTEPQRHYREVTSSRSMPT